RIRCGGQRAVRASRRGTAPGALRLCRRSGVSDFTSDAWGLYVALATLISIAACAVLLFVLGRMRVKKPGASGQGTETTGHVWDGDLAEYNNPLPRWWMWLFYATIVFALIYLALYPGLGKLTGAFGWTSAGA